MNQSIERFNFPDLFLKKFSHIYIGGKADFFLMPENNEQIVNSLKFSYNKGIKYTFLGGGSNTLFADRIRETIIISDNRLPKRLEIHPSDMTLVASSNLNINYLIHVLKAYSLCGLEFLSSIPAHLGGLVKMNAGAFSEEIGKKIAWMKVATTSGECVYKNSELVTEKSEELLQKYCADLEVQQLIFGYRNSNITGFINLVCLITEKKMVCDIDKKVKENLSKRQLIQPLDKPNLGSIYKNPDSVNETGKIQVTKAWELIDRCGFRGFSLGDAQVSEKHANFIINKGNATFSEVAKLMEMIENKIEREFGITPEREIITVR